MLLPVSSRCDVIAVSSHRLAPLPAGPRRCARSALLCTTGGAPWPHVCAVLPLPQFIRSLQGAMPGLWAQLPPERTPLLQRPLSALHGECAMCWLHVPPSCAHPPPPPPPLLQLPWSSKQLIARWRSSGLGLCLPLSHREGSVFHRLQSVHLVVPGPNPNPTIGSFLHTNPGFLPIMA